MFLYSTCAHESQDPDSVIDCNHDDVTGCGQVESGVVGARACEVATSMYEHDHSEVVAAAVCS